MRSELAGTCLVVAALALPLGAQRVQDPEQLMRLQPVLRTALERVAPSVVRIETFGGVRRVLGPDGSAVDSVGEVGPSKMARSSPL